MKNIKPKKKSSIGGQAVLEGVMMRGPDSISMCVRKPDGEVVIEKKPYKAFTEKVKVFKLPILRGVVAFFESMIIGMKTLMNSADYYDIDVDEPDYKPSKFEEFITKLFGDKLKDAIVAFSLILSIFLGVGLFIVIPNIIAKLTFSSDRFMYNVVEGIVRLVIFFLYIVLISYMEDIRRVFQYHGAEHKTIHCYEHEECLTVENIRKYPVLHPRCGTSFLLIVMVVSIGVFSFFWDENFWITLSERLALLPLVAGISYEIIKYAGKSESMLAEAISVPGLWMQKFTTREPDDSQIEVAIKALENVIVEDPEADRW
ncbi:MAG: DUF1385 domain-containing protein [Ignavibacteriales bacterium]